MFLNVVTIKTKTKYKVIVVIVLHNVYSTYLHDYFHNFQTIDTLKKKPQQKGKVCIIGKHIQFKFLKYKKMEFI